MTAYRFRVKGCCCSAMAAAASVDGIPLRDAGRVSDHHGTQSREGGGTAEAADRCRSGARISVFSRRHIPRDIHIVLNSTLVGIKI